MLRAYGVSPKHLSWIAHVARLNSQERSFSRQLRRLQDDDG
jgi:hypothetical protein